MHEGVDERGQRAEERVPLAHVVALRGVRVRIGASGGDGSIELGDMREYGGGEGVDQMMMMLMMMMVQKKMIMMMKVMMMMKM